MHTYKKAAVQLHKQHAFKNTETVKVIHIVIKKIFIGKRSIQDKRSKLKKKISRQKAISN